MQACYPSAPDSTVLLLWAKEQETGREKGGGQRWLGLALDQRSGTQGPNLCTVCPWTSSSSKWKWSVKSMPITVLRVLNIPITPFNLHHNGKCWPHSTLAVLDDPWCPFHVPQPETGHYWQTYLPRCNPAWAPNPALLLAVGLGGHWHSGNYPSICALFLLTSIKLWFLTSHESSSSSQVAPVLRKLTTNKTKSYFCRKKASACH